MTQKTLYSKPKSLTDKVMHYCPGCSHSVVHKLLAEIIDEFDIQKDAIFIAPVGCAVLLYDYIDCDTVEASHGRAAAVATGIKRVKPNKQVISYQGDGDLLAIGMGETLHAANRGENITVVFINNAIYGMTGGQMAPTTLVGQKTATTAAGRKPSNEGYPIGACELINTLQAPYFIERCKVNDSKSIIKTKNILKKALKYQMEDKGYSFVEILSNCPTNWGLSPKDSNKWIEDIMQKNFPIGNFRDNGKEA
ncbi:MAG: 2-oxoglutarate oxidoreductase [Spirochaetes bacterium GWD1_27_9]|nr:MAG: 2-oxoglutarate oxidoreductase [Spirochaetes bacterium GWB1_27_13]OHD20115.1 MAG: 2-oxoglutarate oxidoreductase [Spirochaetes bacterium GWC1_27_15]OHD28841.1 MAG: 2-oxoglutarate oxidoreductase [Spirochaetes bacterium GWD1_27_9]